MQPSCETSGVLHRRHDHRKLDPVFPTFAFGEVAGAGVGVVNGEDKGEVVIAAVGESAGEGESADDGAGVGTDVGVGKVVGAVDGAGEFVGAVDGAGEFVGAGASEFAGVVHQASPPAACGRRRAKAGAAASARCRAARTAASELGL